MNTKLIPFDPDKAKKGAKVVTRNGLPVRICFYDLKGGEFPIAGAVKEKNNTEAVRSFTMKGRHYPYDKDSPYDLFIEEEQEKPQREYSGTDSIYVPKDDEGIREELIDAINGLWNNDALPMPLSIKRKDAWLAWLEKQGEEKLADNKPKFQEGDWVVLNPGCNAHQIIRVVENATRHTYNYVTVDDYCFNDTAEGVRLWNINDAKPGDILASKDDVFIFKHMYKEIPDICDSYCEVITNSGLGFGFEFSTDHVYPATKEQCDTLFQKIKESGYEWNPDTKELKKIGPRFHEGDWVISEQGRVHQIIRVVENIGSHTYGYDTEDGFYIHDSESGVRLWNINDAKEGDVLVKGSNIFIFHFINDTFIMGFCHINTDDDGFYIDLGKLDGVCLIDDVVTPATKEQCDLLFQRMKEAGYMWNSDKKELHKIDPKFKVGDKVVLKRDKSLVGSITLVSFIGTYCIHFKDFNAGWYSEQELEPYEMIEKEVKTRRMTNQELSWWLRDCPQERREVCREDEDTIYSRYIYRKCDADEEVPDFVRIRKNGGEWMEPLIEE